MTVPDLVGENLGEAQDRYGEQFNIVEEENRDVNRPEGEILDQDPSDGRVDENAKISVTVASGDNKLPDVRGDSLEEARTKLESADFEVRLRIGRASQERAARSSARILKAATTRRPNSAPK
jgi:beta-lactam-binding protein with PASTA domain